MRRNGVTLFAATVVAVSACNKEVDAPTLRKPAPSSRLVSPVPKNVRPDESMFNEIAREVPGYGGHFIDATGALTAYVTDMSFSSAARTAVLTRLADGRMRLAPRRARTRGFDVKIVKGDYSYQQLSDWRDAVFEHILGRVSGVSTDDLDEAVNRVTIGIVPGQEGVEPAVLRQLATLGVPAAAIRFEPATSPALSAGAAPAHVGALSPPLSAPQNLTDDHVDPLVGGLLLEYLDIGSNVKECTIGYTAQLADGTHGFITASHCSKFKFRIDNAPFWQSVAQGDSIGFEYLDPAGGTCPAGWPCSIYRFSDANFVKMTSSRGWSRGVIARPATRSLGGAGSLAVDPVHPYLYVAVAGVDLYEGERIDKIGITTGWTSGLITHTCVDYAVFDGTMTRCSYTSNFSEAGGDSGSPVFYYDDIDGVWAAGVFFGQAVEGAYFSKWENIYNELDAGGVNQPDITTGVTVSLGPVSGSFDGAFPKLTWSPASTTNTSATTVYYIYRTVWDASTYTLLEDGQQVATTTSTSFTDFSPPVSVSTYVGSTQPAQCKYTYIAYGVVAYNTGSGSSSAQQFFRGAANGATPNQLVCP